MAKKLSATVRAETIAAELVARTAVLEEQHKTVISKIDKIEEKQDAMLTELTKYKGAYGMLTLLGTVLFAGVTFFKDWIWARLHG